MKTQLLSKSPGMRLLFSIALTIVALGSDPRAVIGMPVVQDRLLTTPAALIVQLDARGGVMLNETRYGTVANLKKLTARLNEIFAARTRNLVFADRDGASQTNIPLGDRIAKGVYVHPAAGARLTDIFTLLRAIRSTDANTVQLDLNRGDISYPIVVPRQGEEGKGFASAAGSRPDPQFLLLRIGTGRRLSLNAENFATVDALREKLSAIFAQRQQDNEVAPGTNTISRAVWLQIDPNVSQSGVLDVLQAISATYAQPIYLRLTASVRVYQDAPPRKTAKPSRRRPA